MKESHLHLVFSPQSCSLSLLEATITGDRRALATDLLRRIEASTAQRSSRHVLLVGPRGSGKTHLLTYVRKKLQEAPASGSGLRVIALAEEERGVAGLFDLIMAILRVMRSNGEFQRDELPRGSRDEAFREAQRMIADALGKRPALLVIENLSSMLASMGLDEISRLRAFIQGNPALSLLASSTELFARSSRPDHPFYGFFSIQPLEPLDRRQARLYLAQLAQSGGDVELAARLSSRRAQARVNAIFDLTGGNHRLLAMLATFLTVKGLTELVEPFVQTVDRELTPYYQQRLDRLSSQQNKILRAIADHRGRAVTVKEIGRDTYLTSQVISRQLVDLREDGHVRRTQMGRESFYELNEPLLRLVLDIKEGLNRPLPLVVNFLRRWYDAKELRRFESAAPAGIREYYEAALQEVADTTLRLKGDPVAPDAVRPTHEHLPSGNGPIQELGSSDPEVTGEPVSEAIEASNQILDRGLDLRRRGLYAEALLAFDELVTSVGSSDEPALLEKVAKALFNKGITLRHLNRSEEAIAVYDEVNSRFGPSDEPALLEQVAKALVNKGHELGQLNRGEEAIRVYDEVISRFGSSDQPALLERVARALVGKGYRLGQLNRSEEAMAVYEEVVARFEGSDQPVLRSLVADSLAAKARYAFEKEDHAGAIRITTRALGLVDGHAESIAIHIRALLQTGNASRAADFASNQLTGNPSSEVVRFAVARAFLEDCHASKPIMRQLKQLFAGDAETIAGRSRSRCASASLA